MSRKTVARRLKNAGLHARIPALKPLISKRNQRARLEYTREHVVWTDAQWDTVHFSNKSNFTIFGSEGKIYVRRRTGERLSSQCVKKTIKFDGGSVMVWGMISSAGVGPIIRVHDNINAEIYKRLLQQHVVPRLHHNLY